MALLGLSMSLWISLSCLLTTWPRLSLSWWQNCTPLLWLSLAFPGCEATIWQSTGQCCLSPSKQALNQHYHHWLWPGHAQQLPYAMRYYFNLSPAFNSIPELCTSSGPSILNKVVLITKLMSSVKLGPFTSTLLPLWIYTLELTRIHPTQTHATCGSCCHLGFLHWTHSHWLWVGSPPQLLSFPCCGKIMLITISSRVPPQTWICEPHVKLRSPLTNQKV